MSAVVLVGDCRKVIATLPKNFFDAVVTDPPYDLGFMGKAWDKTGVAFDKATWEVVLAALKPGAHLLAFGGTRTYHRMAVAIEDAGFEVRDMVQWLYGTGFPKSMDVGKAIDKAAGKEREIVGRKTGRAATPTRDIRGGGLIDNRPNTFDASAITAPATPEAAQWEGWGTALKPACEPIVLARKPLGEKTVAANVLRYGTGALNVDGTRVGTEAITTHSRGSNEAFPKRPGETTVAESGRKQDQREGLDTDTERSGRWPANVIMDEEAGAMLDAQSGISKSNVRPPTGKDDRGKPNETNMVMRRNDTQERGHADAGGASRFFYCAKASRSERNAGLDHLEERPLLWSSGTQSPGTFQGDGPHKASQNNHPTVKPISLMRYLIRLITPPGGRVLDPFTGSGSTGIAAILEGFNFVGVELDDRYADIARTRINHWEKK